MLRLTTDASVSYVLGGDAFPARSGSELRARRRRDACPTAPGRWRAPSRRTPRAYWRTWTRRLAIPLEWQDAVIRAAITLKLCTFEDTGAIVAAMTTSIPEAPGSGRNWDYRYCWLRDAFFVVRALNSLSEVDTMEHYLRYLGNIVGRPPDGHLQPVYGIGAGAPPRRARSDDACRLSRHGAGARGQPGVRALPARRLRQRRARRRRRPSSTSACCGRADGARFHAPRACRRAGLPGLRARRTRACGSCARASACTPRPRSCAGPPATGSRASRAHRALPERARLLAGPRGADPRATSSRAPSTRGRGSLHGKLRRPRRRREPPADGGGRLPADPGDPRFVGTVDAMEKRLLRGPHLFRYAAADDFGLPTTAFNICTFWYIDALARIGRGRGGARALRADAREPQPAGPAVRGHRSRDAASTGATYPQTYSLVGIVNAAMRLSRAWEAFA